eukprot:7010771-Heterocapsa_arctica.AAC.1
MRHTEKEKHNNESGVLQGSSRVKGRSAIVGTAAGKMQRRGTCSGHMEFKESIQAKRKREGGSREKQHLSVNGLPRFKAANLPSNESTGVRSRLVKDSVTGSQPQLRQFDLDEGGAGSKW